MGVLLALTGIGGAVDVRRQLPTREPLTSSGHDGWVAVVTWRPVGPKESMGGVLDGMVRAVESTAGAPAGQQGSGVAGVRRFRSAEGGSAILVPANLLGVVSADPRSSVLIVDPPDVGSALALLAQLGSSAGPVMIAVPVAAGAQETARLVAQPGGFSTGPGSAAVEFGLYAVSDRTESDRRLASGPRPGEDQDTLDGRARWFDSRHGGPG